MKIFPKFGQTLVTIVLTTAVVLLTLHYREIRAAKMMETEPGTPTLAERVESLAQQQDILIEELNCSQNKASTLQTWKELQFELQPCWSTEEKIQEDTLIGVITPYLRLTFDHRPAVHADIYLQNDFQSERENTAENQIGPHLFHINLVGPQLTEFALEEQPYRLSVLTPLEFSRDIHIHQMLASIQFTSN